MRLDHLLSKEHHETQARPRPWEFGDLSDSLDGLSPVVGGGLVQMTNVEPQRDSASVGFAVRKSSDTLLGFEATSPLSLRPECGKPGIGIGCRPALVVGCGV